MKQIPRLFGTRGWLPLLLSPLLLLLLGCGGSPSGQTGTPVPQELQGQWQTILSYVPGYYQDPSIDQIYVDPYFMGSIGIYFYFWPDGRYQQVVSSMMTYYKGNCFRNSRWNEFGTVSIVGSQFTFRPNQATYIVSDTCGKSEYLDHAPTQVATLTMTPDQDQSGWPLLRINLPSSEEIVLEKCKDCK